jgi:hypothetical protein
MGFNRFLELLSHLEEGSIRVFFYIVFAIGAIKYIKRDLHK